MLRLSLNFRLKASSSTLDSKSHRDLDRLSKYLLENHLTEITAIGFSSDISQQNSINKDEQSNVQRSLRLAYMISFGLRKRGVKNIKVIGLGTILPLASDETESGILKNSRVEIWVKPV